MSTTIVPIVERSWLTSARLARNTNLAGTYSNGTNGIGATLLTAASTLTIDGVAVENGDRVLLFAQTNSYENGLYQVSGVGSAVLLTRSPDFQSAEQMKPGFYVSIAAGTEFNAAILGVVEPQVQVVGEDGIVFVHSASTSDTATFSNTGLQVYDTDGTHLLTYRPGSNLTANRTLNFTTGDADRTLTMTGDATLNQDVSSTGNPAFSSVTVANTGLHILDTNASHDLIIAPGTDLSADRTLTLSTGDADRALDISAADVTVSSFGASLVDDASNLAALTTLNIKRGTTAAYGGGGTSNAFIATGLLSTDIVIATILSQSNAGAIVSAAPTADTLTVTFSADPGANTVINWIAIPTV